MSRRSLKPGPLIGLASIVIIAALLLNVLDFRGGGKDGSDATENTAKDSSRVAPETKTDTPENPGGNTNSSTGTDSTSNAKSGENKRPEESTSNDESLPPPHFRIEVMGGAILVDGKVMEAEQTALLAKADPRPTVVVWHASARTSAESQLLAALKKHQVAFSEERVKP